MGELEAVRALEAELAALAKVRREIGPVPLDTFFKEVAALIQTVKLPEVRIALHAVGLSPGALDKLPVAQLAAQEAQAAWLTVKARSYSSHLVELIHRAHHERGELLVAARFHLSDDRAAVEALSHVTEGHSLDNLVQDLFILWRLVEKNAHAFARDQTFVAYERARAARDLAAKLQISQSTERLDALQRRLKEQRDRCYTLLTSLVDEIRRTGRYAFRSDPALLVHFSSNYERVRRRRRAPLASSTSEHDEPTLVPLSEP